ncbi:MAG: hypothetical protein IT328_21320 [Caldilineaceae bacterium]|nr:hypothetical protein [Caldilineaceae bacterium]
MTQDDISSRKTESALLPMPTDFQASAEAFNPTAFSYGMTYERKLHFLQLIIDSGAQQQEIIEMYNKLFPDSEIVKAIKSNTE